MDVSATYLETIRICSFARWQPEIGDPSLGGWLTVACYGLACVVAGLVVTRGRGVAPPMRRRERLFWLLICLLMLGLGINKQLDLQSLLTAVGRCVAQTDGWYAERRAVQAAFIALLSVGGLLGVLLTAAVLWTRLPRNGLAVLGLGVLVTFVLIRAIGFHHFDRVIEMETLGLRVNWILEIGGILLVALNGLLILRLSGRAEPLRVATPEQLR